jgi:hypothetical protein
MRGEEERPDAGAGERKSDERNTGSQKTGKELVGVEIMTGLRLIVLLLILLAAVQLYFTIQGVISIWVAAQFIPLINTIYYLVVIVGGIWLLWKVLSKH